MITIVQRAAERDLEEGFEYYERVRAGLGTDFVTEFRRAVDRILTFPRGWHALDDLYRRCQFQRFPYGIVYRIDEAAQQIIIVAIQQLQRDQDRWRDRLP